VLQKLGVKNEALRREIEKFVPVGSEAVTAAKIPYTPRAREALQLAANEARKLNQPHIKAEHIFLGLLREGSGVAAVVLKKLGVRLENARAEVSKEMTAHPEAG
jgi:ATP-dependent Clp protease ATP-binding subunit ClpC